MKDDSNPTIAGKHWVQPDAIAAVIAFLASDAAYAVTGAAFRFLGRVE